MFKIRKRRKESKPVDEITEQKSNKTVNIRDFLYLDVERVKSIFAQLEEGLVTGRERVGGTTKEVSGKGEGGIPALLNLAAKGKFIWENEERETKTLHDYIYHYVESKIRSSNMVTIIDNSTITLAKLKSDELRLEMNEKPFLLISGKITLDDYEYMKGILKDFNDLSEFIARCSVSKETTQLTEEQREQLLSKNRLDEWTIEGYLKFFDIFYKERCMVTLYTNADVPDISFTGFIKKDFIRDGMESVMFRYGTSPQITWKVFAQIACISIKDESMHISMIPEKARSFDESLRGFLDEFRGIEKMANAISYPAISIIPIAIYK